MVAINFYKRSAFNKRAGASSSGGGGGRSGGSSSSGSSSSGSSSSGSSSSSGGAKGGSSSSGSSSSGSSSSGTKGGSGSSGSSSSGSSSSSGGGKSSGTTGNKGGTPGSSSSSSFSGGGSPRTISSGSFSGRTFGGAPRTAIYGGAAFGGSYFYSASRPYGYYGVGGLGFPFGYWPVYYGAGYYGDGEYGPHTNASRPGGVMSAASYSAPGFNNSVAPQYLIYGDSNSVNDVVGALNQCDGVLVVNTTALTDDGTYATGTNLTLLPIVNPAQIASYYRDSSFALATYFTNNTVNPNATVNFTIPANTPSPTLYDPSTTNATFASCMNDTIANVLPIEAGSSSAASLGVRPSKAMGGVVVLMAMLLGGENRVLQVAILAIVLVAIAS